MSKLESWMMLLYVKYTLKKWEALDWIQKKYDEVTK